MHPLDTFRSLCADLAAANTFTVDHLDVPENAAQIEKAKFFYISVSHHCVLVASPSLLHYRASS